MLQESKAFPGFAVDDLDRARSFYGSTLGLEVKDNEQTRGMLHRVRHLVKVDG